MKRHLVLLCTILASGMAFLDSTVVTVVLPTLQTDLGATVSQIQWILEAYLLGLAALLLTAGTLADNLGHKRIFLFGVTFFTLGSLLCGLASSATALIWARGVQGIGGAFMIPGSLAIIYDSYRERERGRAIGIWAGLSGGLAALGPLTGAWLTETFSWHVIFFINIPIGLLAIVLIVFVVAHKAPAAHRRLDWAGTGLITAALLLLALGAIEAPNLGPLHPLILASFSSGLVCLGLFLWWEMRARDPMLPLSLFRNRNLSIANVVTFCTYFTRTSIIFLIALNLQQLQRYTPIEAGLGLTPPIILITFFSWIGGKITDARGPRLPLTLGNLLIAIGVFWAAFAGPGANYWSAIFPGLMGLGLGMTLVVAPMTKAAISVEQTRAGIASGVNRAVARIASLIAFAVAGTALAFVFRVTFLEGIDLLSFTETAKEGLVAQVGKLGAIQVPAELSNGDHVRALIDNSFATSYYWGMFGNGVVALVSVLVAYLGLRPVSR